MVRIPLEVISRIDNYETKETKYLQVIIEDEAYSYIERHPDTLWTGLELVEKLKERYGV